MAGILHCKFTCFNLSLRLTTLNKAVSSNKFSQKRFLSSKTSKSKNDNKSSYKNTVLLPKTEFRLWLDPRQRAQHDYEVMQKCKFASLYDWQRNTCHGTEYVLHDGPPYANGAPHVGHAVNKILKDIIMRHELLNGKCIHFIPGWDCHGLPIELKAVSTQQKDGNLSPLEIRNKARKFAKQTIDMQRSAFESWGILGNWDRESYFTFDKTYVKNELQSFFTLYEKGLVYRELKPIHWSPSSRTALAEAELMYNENHKSTCVTLRMRLVTPPFNVTSDKPLYALIWTTTPWSLPANEAISFRSDIEYCIVEIENHDGSYIVAKTLVPNLAKSLSRDVKVMEIVSGKALKRVTYEHPLRKGEVHRFFHGDHVTDSKGTGLIHCAPGHGREDYIVGVENSLPITSVVDKEGKFAETSGPQLSGKDIFGDGGQMILDLLKSDIIHTEELKHSYPYDWRTNKPVIMLASRQWFFDCSSVRDSAVNEIKNVDFAPKKDYVKHMAQLLEQRPFWCISRQRVWGVPIPVLFKRDCTKPIISKSLIEHYCSLIDKVGPDFWWSLSIEELCPKEIATEIGIEIDEVERCPDILDIWFDSGLSWLTALDGRTADLCLEGIDQFTGWFQSSMLTSIALKGKSPYKKLYVHGFVVDENGHKMSKSLGNIIDPQEIIMGGKNQDKQPAYGADTLRWWVASHSVQHASIPISMPLIKSCFEIIQKLRGTVRYCLGALSGFPPSSLHKISDDQLFIIDLFMLSSVSHLQTQIQDLYMTHKYNKICSVINDFVVNNVSALYLNLTKDRLYCERVDSSIRQSSQFVIYHILECLLQCIAPIAPLLVEEAYLYHPCNADMKTFFEYRSQDPFVMQDKWKHLSIEGTIERALDIRSDINKHFGTKDTWEVAAEVHVSHADFGILKPLVENQSPCNSQLSEILQVGSVELKLLSPDDIGQVIPNKFTVEVKPLKKSLCRRCRRFESIIETDICKRCESVVKSLSPFL